MSLNIIGKNSQRFVGYCAVRAFSIPAPRPVWKEEPLYTKETVFVYPMKTPLFSVVRRASTEIQSATDSEKGAKEHHVEGYDDDGYTYHKYPKQGPIRMVGAMLSIIASYYVLFAYDDPPRWLLYSVMALIFVFAGLK